MGEIKSEYDRMREADDMEEDAYFPDDLNEDEKSEKEKYFEYYDDIKTDIREDW